MFRLSLARRVVPLAPIEQLQLTTSFKAGVSSSFATDIRFIPKTEPEQFRELTTQIINPEGILLCATSIRPVDTSLSFETRTIEVDFDPVSIHSRLAIFVPFFRIEGKNYVEYRRELRIGPGERANRGTRNSGSRHKVPHTASINRWDALWPLLQPPLNFAFPESLDLPSELRPYQIDGIKFLTDRSSALLGDDMGTGKTVQTVVALRILLQKGVLKRALIVCPLAVLSSWEEHLLNWGRVLKSVTVRGNKQERRLQWQMAAHVYLTTYDIVREDSPFLSGEAESDDSIESLEFDLIVADEVQKIKNGDTATSKAMRSVAATRRWGLSATPFENDSEELVSVFGFIRPGLLCRNSETPQSIKQKIAPFFLRRTKDLLKGELPDKVHDLVWLELGHNQRRAYELAEQQGIVELEKRGEKVTISHILALLQKLKQICNFDPKTWESIKLETLRERLDELASQGSKALVFTQFKDFGVKRIKDAFRSEGAISYTGDLADSERRKALERLRDDPDCKLMVCTQAAAGLGLNLTVANYVFHFDHWWNQARTAQAEGRVYRIGQTKTVFVYHFWVKNTIEEEIYNILQRKRAQFEEIIGSIENSEGTGLSEDELFGIFGLKKAVRHHTATTQEPVRETSQSEIPDIPDIDVWPLIRKAELALRRCIRQVLFQKYGTEAGEKVLSCLGPDESAKINKIIEQYRKKYTDSSSEFSSSEDPLDYTYLGQMMTIISREWQLFKPVFLDRGYVDKKIGEIATVRNDEAHFRGIPPVEKMRAYVACADLIARLQKSVVAKP